MKCERCGGPVMLDDDGDKSCRMCGHKVAIAEPQSGLEINIRLRPKNLPELYAAVAMTSGKTTHQFLKDCGLSPADARRVASGAIVHPGVALDLIQRYGVTATDFVALMKAGATDTTHKPRTVRGPYRRRKDATETPEVTA